MFLNRTRPLELSYAYHTVLMPYAEWVQKGAPESVIGIWPEGKEAVYNLPKRTPAYLREQFGDDVEFVLDPRSVRPEVTLTQWRAALRQIVVKGLHAKPQHLKSTAAPFRGQSAARRRLRSGPVQPADAIPERSPASRATEAVDASGGAGRD